jgi:autotransporter passenger strand-loop-strand repeat protein
VPVTTQTVASGQTSSGLVIQGGNLLNVASGGTVVATLVGSGGQDVLAGGLAISTTLASGGSEYVATGGSAVGSVVSGGLQVVSGGATSGSVVSGTTSSPVFSSLPAVAGSQAVVTGAAFGTVVGSNGFQIVSSGGTTSGATLVSGGREIVSGGTAIATRVGGADMDGGYLIVISGSAVGAVITVGRLMVEGGAASGTLISHGGDDEVYAGIDSGTVVSSGGYEFVNGGAAYATVVSAGGSQYLRSGATIGAVVVGAVTSGGAASSQVISGVQVVAGGVASGTAVGQGGKQTVNSGGVTFGTVIGSGGTEDVQGNFQSQPGAASGSVINGGRLEVDFGGTASFVAFAPGTAGLLVISSGGSVSGAISGFMQGDTIDLAGLRFVSAQAPTLTSGQLVVSQGGVTQTLQLDPGANYAGDVFSVTADAAGGSEITACFAAGTRIATARGEVTVEALRVGDVVLTLSGAPRPIIWLGHRRVDCRRHPRPHDVWPVRVRAHAFAQGQPARDLWLSPDHALQVDGALIPARHLVNGASIAQMPVDTVTYWHVELPGHDILLAEGMPCESYLDTGNRSAFANGGSVVQVHPDFAGRHRPDGPSVSARQSGKGGRYDSIDRFESPAA